MAVLYISSNNDIMPLVKESAQDYIYVSRTNDETLKRKIQQVYGEFKENEVAHDYCTYYIPLIRKYVHHFFGLHDESDMATHPILSKMLPSVTVLYISKYIPDQEVIWEILPGCERVVGNEDSILQLEAPIHLTLDAFDEVEEDENTDEEDLTPTPNTPEESEYIPDSTPEDDDDSDYTTDESEYLSDSI